MKQFLYLSALMIILSGTQLQAQQWDGLTLYANQNSAVGYLIDTASTVVKTFNFIGNTGYSAHMMPGGFIFRTVSNTGNSLQGGGITGRIQKLDYNGTILWDYTYSSSTYCLHHDHCPLPNGNVLVISYDVRTASEAVAAGSTSNTVIWSEKIMELQPVGTNSAIVVWEWKVWDHLMQNADNSKANYVSSLVDNPQLFNINYKTAKDWIHMNGVDYNPVLDQISLSSHNLNEWYIIDHSTTTAEAASHTGGNSGKGGDILYRWGNPAAYGASGSAILNVTHDAHWIPEDCPNAGYLAGLNNRGQTSPSSKSTADNIITPRTGFTYTTTQGSAFSPSSYTNRYITNGYTTNMGNTEQFPNGNQMICLATVGSIIEVDAAGNILWTKSTGGTTPQAHRYSTCYINNPAPTTPSITLTGSVLSTATAASYQWYLDGSAISGATLQSLTPTVTGKYLVRTTDSNGCVYVYSSMKSYSVDGGTGPIDTGIDTQSLENGFSVYPNPSNGLYTVEVPVVCTITITDITGKTIEAAVYDHTVDIQNVPAGIYLLNARTESGITLTRKLIKN